MIATVGVRMSSDLANSTIDGRRVRVSVMISALSPVSETTWPRSLVSIGVMFSAISEALA